MCSFCGGNTHDYRDCPVMHQYIREQADALAQRRMGEYHTTTGVGGNMKSQGKYHLIRGLSLEGEDQMTEWTNAWSGTSLSREIQDQGAPTKSGMTGSA